MLMEGKRICLRPLGDGFYQLLFNNGDESVNKLDQATLAELKQAVDLLYAESGVTGLLIGSAKDSFIVGADVTEFSGLFALGEAALIARLQDSCALFNRIEDMPWPTVAAINGVALGGGFELALACDYRVLAANARVGLPETRLGIHPGWGGTVRLPRLIGVDNANEWICGAGEQRADKALAEGAVDAVVAPERLAEAALDLLQRCVTGDFDYRVRRQEKQAPVLLNRIEQLLAFESARALVGAKAGPHYPAPLTALETMQRHAGLARDEALQIEHQGIVKLAAEPSTAALVGLFLNDQALKKIARRQQGEARPPRQAAVLGAGIMGGGIAYQSAACGVPVLLKDIREEALQLGLDEAGKLLKGQLERGRIDTAGLTQTLTRIRPTLSFGDFAGVELAVEAVVENLGVKQAVLAELETQVDADCVLCSNTSTLSISELSTVLERPQNFCGMHFFNPVHKMPLVEVIRGQQTSAATLARTLAYARALGKTPIVVNDCPGFFVNRVLFPYFVAFSALLRDGADYRQIDRVMEGFGWPMGPAYLLDVIGIDTACHADAVMAAGYPDRMQHEGDSAIERLYHLQRLGQKSAAGFYRYQPDRKGRAKKQVDDELPTLLAGVLGQAREFSDEEIIERMMIPLCLETQRCLEEGIVASAAEADLGLIYGIGFPPFRGGVLYSIDREGAAAFCARAERYADLGKLYWPTDQLRAMAASGARYFEPASAAPAQPKESSL